MRDHQPVLVPGYNGLWKRGTADSCPPDHFSETNNVTYIESGVKTRDGIDPFLPIADVVRMYNYKKVSGDFLIVMDINGNFYDSEFLPTVILNIGSPGNRPDDFGFYSFNRRAYITPSQDGVGMQNEFVYVYDGTGNPARQAAGQPPVDADGALAAANSASPGNVEPGFRIYAVAYETESGFITSMGPNTLPTLTSPGGFQVDLTNIPVSPESFVVARHVLATKAIVGYDGVPTNYEFFFVPGGEIADNSTTSLTIDFFDGDLLDSASNLLDLYAEIPAGFNITSYNERMVVYNIFGHASYVLASTPGAPEEINQIDGIINISSDDQPTTNVQPLRGVLYIFRQNRTWAATDNGDAPSSWSITEIESGLGAGYHGIAQVLELGSVNIENLLVANFSGLFMFDGKFNYPSLSWKIDNLWTSFDFEDFRNIQVLNDTILKQIYMIAPDSQQIFMANYNDSLDTKNIKWYIWTFGLRITCIMLTQHNKFLIGAIQNLTP